MTFVACRHLKKTAGIFLAVLLVLACASAGIAQQKDKDSKKKKKPAENAESSGSVLPLSDEQQVDYLISEMLGAWQIGDTERLRKDYADDVSVVNGNWAPPIIGWPSFLAGYQQQRLRLQQVRMDRTNTYIRVSGSVAWACYQWDFSGMVDGQPAAYQGQTTLVMEKRNGKWVIAHNHTSVVQMQQPAPANTRSPAAAPADKPAAN